MPKKPSLGAYVLDAPDIHPGWVLAYTATLALQMVCATVRMIVVGLTLEIAFWILGEPNWLAEALALTIGYGPLALSFATLLVPVGGLLWMQQAGGRTPSERERLIYEDALSVLADKDPGLRPPRRWFVLDEHYLNAAAYADTLMVTRGLLESGFLEAVLAHELGHLNSSDARLAAALHRMTTPPAAFPVAHDRLHRLRSAWRVGHPHAVGGLLALPRVPRRPVRSTPPGSAKPSRSRASWTPMPCRTICPSRLSG